MVIITVSWFVTELKMIEGVLHSVDDKGLYVLTDVNDPSTKIHLDWSTKIIFSRKEFTYAADRK